MLNPIMTFKIISTFLRTLHNKSKTKIQDRSDKYQYYKKPK